MDSAQQASGEKRVRALLVEPLMRRGLAKPSSLTRAQFEAMLDDLCARLAYMTDANLAALEEQVAANPAGKDRDRLPIAQHILDWAGQIQPPGDDASPLIRAVFASGLGSDALAGGWAPELLHAVRRARRWPGAFALTEIQRAGADNTRQLTMIDEALAANRDVPRAQLAWRDQRRAVLDKCQRIADLARHSGGAA